MSEPPVENEELDEQEGDLLPDREAMSVLQDPLQSPGIEPSGIATIAPTEPSDLE